MATYTTPTLTVHLEGRNLRLVGEADVAGLEALTQAFAQLQADGAEAASLDLAELSFVDSSFLKAVVQWADRFGGPETVTLVDARPNVRRLLDVTGIGRYLAMDPPLD